MVAAIEEASRLPANAAATGSLDLSNWRRDCGPRGVFMGYDFHLAGDALARRSRMEFTTRWSARLLYPSATCSSNFKTTNRVDGNVTDLPGVRSPPTVKENNRRFVVGPSDAADLEGKRLKRSVISMTPFACAPCALAFAGAIRKAEPAKRLDSMLMRASSAGLSARTQMSVCQRYVASRNERASQSVHRGPIPAR